MLYYATADEMGKLDDLAVAGGLQIRQMMELAGWHMLSVFRKLSISEKTNVVIVCGKGNKGGDGLSAARHLVNYGYKVSVVLLEKDLKPDPQHHLQLLRNIDIPFIFSQAEPDKASETVEGSDLVIDALIGYRLSGVPRDKYAEVINSINKLGKGAISYDLPTGIDATTGECYEPCIRANATLTLALPKKAFTEQNARNMSGKIFLADIGIPNILYDKISKGARPPFDLPEGSLITL